MRIHASDPVGRHARAFLDNVEVSDLCVQADDVEGWVDLLTRDKEGKIVPTLDGDALIKRSHGIVKITLDDANSSLYA